VGEVIVLGQDRLADDQIFGGRRWPLDTVSDVVLVVAVLVIMMIMIVVLMITEG
jgi:hypothetical protein